MADFLTRLVERTWGIKPVVQPVITPLFYPEHLPGKTAIKLEIQENSEQINFTSSRSNSRQKNPKNSPELPVVSEPEQNSQSFREVEEEFLIQNHSADIQTSSNREASEQSISSAISRPSVNSFSSFNKTQKFKQKSTQDLTQDFTQKDSPLIQSQNRSDGTVNQSDRRFPQKSNRNLDNDLDSTSENELTLSGEPTLLPNQNRVDWLEKHEVKQVESRQFSNSNLSQKLPIPRPQEPSTQTDQKQQPQKQQKIQAVEQPVPPTIKVKIGRIEVRANTSEPRTNSPVQSPKPPRLSLDEYLRSNSGGKS